MLQRVLTASSVGAWWVGLERYACAGVNGFLGERQRKVEKERKKEMTLENRWLELFSQGQINIVFASC